MSRVQVRRTLVPPLPHVKSVGHACPCAPQAIAPQWWSAGEGAANADPGDAEGAQGGSVQHGRDQPGHDVHRRADRGGQSADLLGSGDTGNEDAVGSGSQVALGPAHRLGEGVRVPLPPTTPSLTAAATVARNVVGGRAVAGLQVGAHRARDSRDNPRDAVEHLRPIHGAVRSTAAEGDPGAGGGDRGEPGLFQYPCRATVPSIRQDETGARSMHRQERSGAVRCCGGEHAPESTAGGTVAASGDCVKCRDLNARTGSRRSCWARCERYVQRLSRESEGGHLRQSKACP